MTTRSTPRVIGRLGLLIVIAGLAVVPVDSQASAATVTRSYEVGRLDVTINGYGTSGMGTFRLADGDADHVALCVEADVPHTTASDAYGPVPNRVDSPELDVLLWWLDRQASLDADTAVAAAALAWYYAGARRSIGPLVWSDGHRDFAPISPVAPEPWDALPRYTLAHLIGLRSGSTDLDAAERRVAELHALASAWSTPWNVEADRGNRAFVVDSGERPLAGVAVEVTVEAPGADPVRSTAITDASGRVVPDLPDLPDGATVTATVDAPGVHREWDGPGDVQRMATATNRRVSATLEVPPLPRHLEVRKTSSDPTIDVAGAEFELADARGEHVATMAVDGRGRARSGPIDVVRHPGPYLLTEVVAPPGLVRSTDTLTIGALSHDPERPTAVTVVNEPATTTLVVRKQTSSVGVGPADRSGFGFAIVRDADGSRHDVVTGADGTTPPTALPLGEYSICETATPDWAATLVDGGCTDVIVDLTALDGPTLVVDYLNVVPEPAIDTRARDASDGDRVLPTSGGTVVDRVELTGLVPGTEYTVTGNVVAPHGMADLLATELSFVADGIAAVVELTFEIPPVAPGRIVITGTLSVADEVVAVHHDLDDPDQTLDVVAPPSTTTSTTTTTTSSTTTTTTTTTTTSPAATTTVPTATSPTTTAESAGPTVTVPPTLPPTGASEAAAAALRLADAGFALGVALIAAASWLPRRPGRDEAGC